MVIEIFKIFKTVHYRNIPYCKFCLSTAKERSIVEPKYVTQFLKALNLYNTFDTISICFLCEARARTAVKFLYLVNFAKTVDETFDMFCSKSLQNLIQNPTKHCEKRKDMKKAMECNSQYQAVSHYSNLLAAETLIVDTLEETNADCDDGTVNERKSVNKQNKITSDPLETVCLDDDVETEVTIQDGQQNSDDQYQVPSTTSMPQDLPMLVPLKELLNPPANHGYIGTPVLMTKGIGSNFCLFATVNTPLGVEVPLISAVIIDGQLVRKSDLNIGTQSTVSTRNPALRAGVPSKITAPSTRVPSITTAPSTRVPSITAAPSTTVPTIGTARGNYTRKPGNMGLNSTVIQIDEDSNEYTGKKRKITPVTNDQNKSVATTKNATTQIEKMVAPIEVSEGTIVLNNHLPDCEVKKAVQKTNSRIDWEDKIPMDVISFVDTDSNKDFLIVPQENTKPKQKTSWHNPTSDPQIRSGTERVSFEDTYLTTISKNITWNDTSMGFISNVVSMNEDANIVCLDD